MKLLLLAVLLAVPQAPPPAPGPTPDKTAPTQQGTQAPDNSSTPLSSPSQPAPDTNTTKPDENSGATTKPDVSLAPVEISKWPPVSATKGWTDYTYWFFGLLLVVVGFLQVRLLSQTLGAITEQADTMETQAQTMKDQAQTLKDQARIMDQQSKATEEAAKAATLNAKAAIENIEMFISKERARVRVEPKDLSLAMQHGAAYLLEVIVSVYGPTTVFITGSGFSVDIVPSESVGIPKAHGFWLPMMTLPKVISPSTQPITGGTLHPVLIPGKVDQTSEIKESKQFVEIQGFIAYKDVFDRDRVTTFRYYWKYIRWLEGRSNYGVGLWNKCGTDEDNKET
jgi:hypothetical protein